MAHVEDRWTTPSPAGNGRTRTDRYGVGKRWLATWAEADGVRRRKAFTTKNAALAWLEDVGVQQRTGTYISPAASSTTVRAVAERWYLEQVHQRATSLRQVRGRLDRYILPTLGDVPWSAMTRGRVQAAVTVWAGKLAPSTVRVTYVYLAGICTLAVEERRIHTSPCRRINLPPVEAGPIVPLSVSTVQKVVDGADPRYRPLFILAAASGLRIGELVGLTWDRVVDGEDGTAALRVDRQLLRSGSATAPKWGPPKTPGSVRTVPIGKTTRAVLGDRGEGLVFTTRRGGAMMPKVTWQVWHAAADPAGIPAGEAWHALRHFHASLLIAGGASPVAVAHRLGHRNPAETLQTYAHLWPDDDERMRDTADGVVLLPRSEDDLAASAEPPAA